MISTIVSPEKSYHNIIFSLWREPTGLSDYCLLILPTFTSILPIFWLHVFTSKALKGQKVGSYLSIKVV